MVTRFDMENQTIAKQHVGALERLKEAVDVLTGAVEQVVSLLQVLVEDRDDR